jgi:hypothetical protein
MLLEFFALYNRVETIVISFLFQAKKFIRKILGPEVHNVYLLKNGDIVPTSYSNLDEHLPTAHLYDVETQRITNALVPLEGRYKPVNILGLCILLPNGKKVDLSDWVGTIRMNPEVPLSPKTLVDLWSMSTNTYIKFQTVEITDNLGDVHTVTYN